MSKFVESVCIEADTEALVESGTEKFFESDELKKAAPDLAGCPVTSNTTAINDIDTIEVGEVLHSKFIGDVGIKYEAEIHDEDAIYLIENTDVALVPKFEHNHREEDGTILVTDIKFNCLFICPYPCHNVQLV